MAMRSGSVEVERERMWWWMSIAAILVSTVRREGRGGRTGDDVVGEDGEGGEGREREGYGARGFGEVFVGRVRGGGEAEGDGGEEEEGFFEDVDRCEGVSARSTRRKDENARSPSIV